MTHHPPQKRINGFINEDMYNSAPLFSAAFVRLIQIPTTCYLQTALRNTKTYLRKQKKTEGGKQNQRLPSKPIFKAIWQNIFTSKYIFWCKTCNCIKGNSWLDFNNLEADRNTFLAEMNLFFFQKAHLSSEHSSIASGNLKRILSLCKDHAFKHYFNLRIEKNDFFFRPRKIMFSISILVG